MTAVRVIVFDIDDTLYLERDYVRSGFLAVEAKFDIPGFADCCTAMFNNGVRSDTFDRALVSLAVKRPTFTVADLVDAYREHRPNIQLLPDARRALEVYSGCTLACLTDGPIASQRRKIEALRLERWLAPIVIASELGPHSGKPAVDGFVEIERLTRTSGELIAYVADNPTNDLRPAMALSWQVVRVRRPGSLHELTQSPGLPECRSLDRLERLLTLECMEAPRD